MTTPAFEAFLARLYVEDDLRVRFLSQPFETAAAAGLSPKECEAMAQVDPDALELAAHSFAHKRAHKEKRRWWNPR